MSVAESITEEQAMKQSTVYFGGEELPASVFVNKYALRDSEMKLQEETPSDMHRRISKEFARIENKKFEKPYSEEEIYSFLDGFGKIVPQGSPMFGIGNPYQIISLSNCYVVPSPEDSYGGICLADQQLVQISKRRGGVGVDISKLRPEGTLTKNAAKTSTGIIPFLERFSNSIREVGQAGRRGALMTTISVHHPEVLNFAKIKNDLTKVTGANISVRLSDEFLEAVEKNETYELRWPVDAREKGEEPEISMQVEAVQVWKEIVKNAHAMAEPGLLFWDNIVKQTPADCYAEFGFKTVSTNPSLREDTLVLTQEGVFPIKWLAENKPKTKVMNYRGEWHDCDVFKSGENKKLVKITFSNQQSVYCTEEHKWPVLNSLGKMVNNHTGKVIKKKSTDLKNKDKIYFPKIEKPLDNKNSSFSKEDGFILGWNQGNGWVCTHKANGGVKQYGFIFSEEDMESGISNRILNYTNGFAKISSKLRKDHDTKSYSYVTTDKNVREQFNKIGATYKENGIPETVWEGNCEFVKGYVDGIFSADGYVEYREKLSNCRIVLVSCHKKLIEDIQKLLCFYGIRSNIRYSFCKEKYHRYDLVITGIHAAYFAETFSLSNTNKNEKLVKISKLERTSKNKKSNRKECSNARDYLVVSKVEITDIYEDVYDITVHDDTHTFVMETGVTGNCSEIPLCPYDSCRLLVINLLSCVDNPFTNKAEFNFEKLKENAYFAQRMMDNLIDLELECIDKIINKIKQDPEIERIKRVEKELWESIRDVCAQGRRTGTGITALGDVMAALGIKYASSKSIDLAEEIYKTIKLTAYRCSVDMAKEVGPFPCYDSKLEEDCPFIQRIAEEDPVLYKDMVKYGRRNIALLTIAPTGSVSILTQTTSGVEPLFQVMYIRRRKVNPNDTASRVDFTDKNGDKWQEYPVYHPQVKSWLKANKDKFTSWLKNKFNNEEEYTKTILSVTLLSGTFTTGFGNSDYSNLKFSGFDVENKYVQEFVSEYNPWKGSCAEDLDWKKRVELQARIQQHCDHAISSTINLPNEATEEQVAEIYETAWKAGCKGITVYRDGCRDGVLITKKEEKVSDSDDFHANGIVKNRAPKRPESLPAELFHTSVKKMRYYVAVGFKKDDPFEVFTGVNHDNDGEIVIPKNVSKGEIIKKARGKYIFVDHETGEEYNLTNGHSDENADALTRSISWGLRHGGGIEHAVHVLEKTKGDLTSFSKSIARALKKLIPDGTVVSGEECKNCRSHNLTRQEGCISCKDCGWTKCS